MLEEYELTSYAVQALENRHEIDLVGLAMDLERKMSHDSNGQPIAGSMVKQAVSAFLKFVSELMDQFQQFGIWDSAGRAMFFFYAYICDDIELHEFAGT